MTILIYLKVAHALSGSLSTSFLVKLEFGLFGIRFQGSKIFNSLNKNIQSGAAISLFKSRLKTCLNS